MSDQIAVMNNGVFEQTGTAKELYYEPQTAFVAGFVGEANRFAATIKNRTDSGLQMTTARGQVLHGTDAVGGLAVGDMVNVFVRPEAVRLSRNAEGVSGLSNAGQRKVENVLFNGANSQLILRDQQSGAEMSVALPQTGEFRDLSRGDLIHFGWEHLQTRVYAATGDPHGH